MKTCIFCKSSQNSFTSVEHIFPESLGNKEKILPKGVVCDRCNNETLSSLDEELLEFEPIKFLRTMNGVESKRGRVPITNLSNLRIENPTKDHVMIHASSKKSITDQTPNGFKLHFKGNKEMDVTRLKRISRSLYKIGLELICLDHGIEFALSERFDEARDIILGKKDFSGYLLIGTTKNSGVAGMRYRPVKDETGFEFMVFEFQYLFVYIIFDMERRQSIPDNGTKLAGFDVLKF